MSNMICYMRAGAACISLTALDAVRAADEQAAKGCGGGLRVEDGSAGVETG